jgi:hypothetical protein
MNRRVFLSSTLALAAGLSSRELAAQSRTGAAVRPAAPAPLAPLVSVYKSPT